MSLPAEQAQAARPAGGEPRTRAERRPNRRRPRDRIEPTSSTVVRSLATSSASKPAAKPPQIGDTSEEENARRRDAEKPRSDRLGAGAGLGARDVAGSGALPSPGLSQPPAPAPAPAPSPGPYRAQDLARLRSCPVTVRIATLGFRLNRRGPAAPGLTTRMAAPRCSRPGHQRPMGMSEHQDVSPVPGDQQRRCRAAELVAVAHVQRQLPDRNRQLARQPRIVGIVHVAVDRLDRRNRRQRIEHRPAADIAGVHNQARHRQTAPAISGRSMPCVSEMSPTRVAAAVTSPPFAASARNRRPAGSGG